MPTNKNFLSFILEQLSGLENIRTKQMMGEYLIYYKDKLLSYVCDNSLLLKVTDSCKAILPEAELVYPYKGAKTKMLLIEDVDNKDLLETLFLTAYKEL